MKNILLWITTNKIPLLGYFCATMFFFDSLFDFFSYLHIQEGWYYTFMIILFLIVGMAINSKGFVPFDAIEKGVDDPVLIAELRKIDEIVEGVENQMK